MASPHSAVVTSAHDQQQQQARNHGEPSDSSTTPRPSADAEAGVAATEVSRERLAPPSRLKSPARTHSPDSWLGYESPNEENTPGFFGEQHQQTVQEMRSTGQAHESSTTRPVRRPALVSRSSHMVAIQPPTLQANGSSSLNDMLSGAEKRRPGAKVGIKDRIACYQWTWFTMVGSAPFMCFATTDAARRWPREALLMHCIHVRFLPHFWTNLP